MQIFVRNVDGKSLAFDVDSDEPIYSLKARIDERQGVPAAEQRLVWSCRQLADDRTFGDYDIERDSTLNLLFRLPGGIIEPSLQKLAQKTNCDKKVCRQCYVRLPERATNCRKKKCGHR